MGWPWPTGYDFNAADNLCNTLRHGGDQLATLVANRGQFANRYLVYSPGASQGWIGTKYHKWRMDFNQSQQLLGKYANQLHARAVEINYFSYTMEGPHHKRRPEQYIPRRDDLNLKGYWAPENPDLNKVEGATPECLYNYSDYATRANNEQFRAFFSKNLAAAAAAAPVADTARTYFSAHSAASLARSVAWCLRNQVLVVDAEVRIVGEAFELADGSLAPNNNKFITFKPSQLPKFESSISNAANSINGANKLLQYVEHNGVNSYVWSELKKNVQDPVYMATFLNGLNPSQLGEVLWGEITFPDQLYPSGVNNADVLNAALTSAYASGLLSTTTEKLIMRQLGPRVPAHLLTALSKNSTASFNFVQQPLSTGDLNTMAIYELSALDEDDHVPSTQPEIIAVYASAINAAPDASSAEQMFHDITTAITSQDPHTTLAPWKTDGQAIQQLIKAISSKEAVTPPAATSPTQLQAWAGSVITQLNSILGPWVTWLKNTQAANQQANTDMNIAVSLLVVAGLTAIPDPPFVASAAVKLAWNEGMNTLQDVLGNVILYFIGEPTDDTEQFQKDFNVALTEGAQRLAITKLLAEGAIYSGPPGKESSQPVPVSGTNVEMIINAYESETKNHSNIGQQWSIRSPDGHDVPTFFFLSAIKNDAGD